MDKLYREVKKLVKLIFGTKEMGGYVPTSGETHDEALQNLCNAYDLDAPANVTVKSDGIEKRLSDIVDSSATVIEFMAVAAKKGC